MTRNKPNSNASCRLGTEINLTLPRERVMKDGLLCEFSVAVILTVEPSPGADIEALFMCSTVLYSRNW
jgi:hypothetical protein